MCSQEAYVPAAMASPPASRHHAVLLCLVCLLPAAPSPGSPRRPAPMARPTVKTQVVMFEDNLTWGTPVGGSLVYRVEGDPRRMVRQPGALAFSGGPVSCIHPAQYDRATLQVRLNIAAGAPAIAIAHNGMADIGGQANPNRGIQVALLEHATVVTDIRTGRTLARIGEAAARRRDITVAISWEAGARCLRVDLPRASYPVRLPEGACGRGGFAIRVPPGPGTRFRVTRIRALWDDGRDLVLYDGTETVYNLDGRAIGRLPSVRLPGSYTAYSTAAVDLRRERSLIVFGGPDLNSDHPETIKGWAVRDLRTGRLETTFGPRVNGCLPLQGGGGLDGYWLLQSWNVPASLCWLDWNAYARGDMARFVVPYKEGRRVGATFVGFHDPANALDGSMARYLRTDETWRGVNHLTVHPNLRPFAPFDDAAMPPPTRPDISHTGPAGLPTQLVVRDRDRAWYEQWAYLGNGLHYQCRGYNLFARRDDWAGPACPVGKDAPPYTDYANMTPDLLHPGRLMAPLIRFSALETGARRIQPIAVHRLTVGRDRFTVTQDLPYANPWPVPFETLMDRRRLLPLASPAVGKE